MGSTDNTQVKSVILRVASFCGLRLSVFSGALLLFVFAFLLVITGNRSASPMYILVAIAVFPYLLRITFFKNKETEGSLPLPLFRQKHKYTAEKNTTMNLAFFLLVFLLTVWQYSYSKNTGAPPWVTFVPLAILVAVLLCRILATVIYRIYFHFSVLRTMQKFDE